MSGPDILTPKEAAAVLGISRRWLRKLAERGDIECISTPNGRLYLRSFLTTYSPQ